MAKKTEHLKRRVILGYASILIVVIIAIIQISNLITRISGDEYRDEPVREKSSIITKTLLILYECETYASFAYEDEEFTQFNQTLDKALGQLELLAAGSADSAQEVRIDELKWLLEQKRKNTELLMKTEKEMKQLYSKHIAEGMKAGRKLVREIEVQMEEEIQQQTLLVQREKKGFFKRLAEAFVPLKADTGLLTHSTTRSMQTDSLINEYDPSDTIVHVLNRIQAGINKEYNSLNLVLEKRLDKLRDNNNIITRKINQLLFEIREEWTNSFLEQKMLREEIVRNTSKSLAVIAFVSLITVLLFLYLIFRDISRIRYYRQQLEVAKQFAEDLLRSREKFMLMISHDIRAPLSSILGYLKLLRQSPSQDKQESYIENIAISSGHILSLANDLLDFHRLESGQMVIRPLPFNAFALFEEIYAEYKPLAHAKGLNFCWVKESFREPYVYTGDPVRIRQAVGNLLSNAIKFTPQGSVSLIVSSEPMDDPERNRLRISVKDEGPGIAESEQEIIFREFSRLAGTEQVEGFGLGLSITFKLVSLLGGSVSLHSRVGEGSEFTILLPLLISGDEPAAAAKDKETVRLFMPERDINCLAIDDDISQLRLTEELLKRNHILVIALSNPNDAIRLLESTSFDLILTDIQMPLLDGYEILRHIRSSGIAGADTIPVIALSASLSEEKEHYLEAGFAGFLNKPFTVEELVGLLNELFSTPLQETEVPLNFSALTAFAEDDAEASASILRTFSEETQKNVAFLQEALENADRPQAARVSHKLIPLFTMLGAGTLVGLLRIIEANEDSLDEAAWQQTLKDAIRRILVVRRQIPVE
ncbi:MAG: response regulator [Tannerellaceae bacterium]|jgi:signal transduction histidine kinase/DNA-binding response OmpR family regulator|nr:response regulator [Tannerellaceae bacterium]